MSDADSTAKRETGQSKIDQPKLYQPQPPGEMEQHVDHWLVNYHQGLAQCDGFSDRTEWREQCTKEILEAISRHVAPLRAENERLQRFVDAVVFFVDDDNLSNQARERNIKALVSAWKKVTAERKDQT